CGDGFVDAPETCEPPNRPDCSATCQTINPCGNGNVDAGEECDPPAAGVCDATCQRIPICGDGFVDAPEKCEPPAVGNCSPTCTFVIDPCGDGVIQPGEQCDVGPASTNWCTPSCTFGGACTDCEVLNCGQNFVDACTAPGNGTLCTAALQCARTTQC